MKNEAWKEELAWSEATNANVNLSLKQAMSARAAASDTDTGSYLSEAEAQPLKSAKYNIFSLKAREIEMYSYLAPCQLTFI